DRVARRGTRRSRACGGRPGAGGMRHRAHRSDCGASATATRTGGRHRTRCGGTTLAAAAPLGRLTREQLTAITATLQGGMRLTPWRGVVLPHLSDPETTR